MIFGQLIDDAIRAHAERAKPDETSAQRMSGQRFTLKKRQRFFNCVDERPAEFEQVATRAARQDDPRHCSPHRPAFGQLASQIRQLDCLAARDLR
jgi:hypothetical protein